MMVSDKLEPRMPFVLVLTFNRRRERGLLEAWLTASTGTFYSGFLPQGVNEALK